MRVAQRTGAIGLSALLGLSLVAGCAEVEERTGLGTEAQVGAAGGAAAGGLIAGVAGGGPAWIAASAILGGIAGGVLGDRLSDRDRQRVAETSYEAFKSEGEGGATSWRNPDTGAYGRTRINDVFTRSDGSLCKRFTQTISSDGEVHTVDGVACQDDDGEWEVVEI